MKLHVYDLLLSARFNTKHRTHIQSVSVIVTLMAIFSANDTVYQSQLKDIGSSPVNEKNTYGANRIDVSYFKANRQVREIIIRGFILNKLICILYIVCSHTEFSKNHIIPSKM